MDLTHVSLDVPYDFERRTLYTPEELLERDSKGMSLDRRIGEHFVAHGGRHPSTSSEALGQRMHDYGVDEALAARIGRTPGERLQRRIVGVMGGYTVPRDDRIYHLATRVGWGLAQADYLVATGGGPGVMEAANLGAMLAHLSIETLDEVIATLAQAPSWEEDLDGYLRASTEVVTTYGPRSPSLAIPTWFYGDEPTNVFATDIAKYFSNGIREEGLLAICRHGVVFVHGGSATLQEAFTDHAQNHNVLYESRAPMVFLGVDRYDDVFHLLREEADEVVRPMLALADTPAEVVAAIIARPPVAIDEEGGQLARDEDLPRAFKRPRG
jgi:predicted Rossmann-fold nucleotide-binding protein